ncbi:MAG: GNAT family N-acetyltransferase [Candidatus Firestonebacteria bacterium]|nr:GNAT family N-acetyltransferase [Candidatus Firestonebacteria bacterium]
MTGTGWPDDEIELFLRMQFDLQQKHYQAHYPGADFQVIWADTRPIGRLYVHRTASEIRIMDIALLPEQRRQGIGTELLLTLIGESEAKGIPLTLHVEGNNPIRAYYARLGFVPGESRGIYCFMERRPGALAGE